MNGQSVIQLHPGDLRSYTPSLRRSWSAINLFADQNQNARYERQNSHHDCSDADVKERSDSDENQIDREQQHSNVFCDHASVLRQAGCLCTQKTGLLLCGGTPFDLHARAARSDAAFLIAPSTEPGSLRSCRVKTSYRLER